MPEAALAIGFGPGRLGRGRLGRFFPARDPPPDRPAGGGDSGGEAGKYLNHCAVERKMNSAPQFFFFSGYVYDMIITDCKFECLLNLKETV